MGTSRLCFLFSAFRQEAKHIAKRGLLVVLVCLFVCPLSVPSQELSSQTKEADIRRLLELMRFSEISVQVGRAMSDSMMQFLERALPAGDRRQEALARVSEEVALRLGSDELLELQASIYDDYFSHDEIKELLQFYESDVAKRWVGLELQLLQGHPKVVQWIQKVMPEILQALMEEFPELQAGQEWEKNISAGRKAVQQVDYAEAERLFLAALEEAEKLGLQDPRLATSLLALGEVYHFQGRHAQAEPLYQRSLAIREKSLGPEHPDVAGSLNDLALLYEDQGRSTAAESLYKRAIAIWENTLGPEHPNVAGSLHNLAELYRAQERYAEAEPLYQRALTIQEKALGPEHPNLAGALHSLAEVNRAQGKYAEAEPLYKRAIAIWEKSLDPEHPVLAMFLKNYASLLRKMNREPEAKRLEARAQAIRAKHGQENPKE